MTNCNKDIDLKTKLSLFEAALRGEPEKKKLDCEERLFAAMEYALFGGGKRVRPALMLLSADAAGIAQEEILPLACALECVHTYSLIHDDLPCMDNDDYRRGRLTVHKAFDEATAVLAGDALLTLAFEIAASAVVCRPNLAGASAALAKAAGDMVIGQSIDMNNKEFDGISLRRMYALKTGALISAAIRIPFLASGASFETMRDVNALANNVGLVFQLADDLLDFRAGQDQDKTTFVTLFGEQATLAEIERLDSECRTLYTKLGPEFRGLSEYTSLLTHRLI